MFEEQNFREVLEPWQYQLSGDLRAHAISGRYTLVMSMKDISRLVI